AHEFLDGIDRVRGYAGFVLIMNQALVSRLASAPVEALVEQHLALVDATVALIRRGQRAGEFRADPAAELATCWFAAVSGLATMRAALGDRFVAPHPATLTGILTRSTKRSRSSPRGRATGAGSPRCSSTPSGPTSPTSPATPARWPTPSSTCWCPTCPTSPCSTASRPASPPAPTARGRARCRRRGTCGATSGW